MKKQSETKEVKKPVPVVRERLPEPDILQPAADSWTYRNYGPRGFIDAHGVPCRENWYE